MTKTVETLHVQGFQSLHNLRMDLGQLTVVVGPSSSGKSALTRALRTLANNARGTDYVTQGMKRTTITATLGPDHRRVRLTRGSGDNGYTLLPPEGKEEESQTFTKLAGEVPPEVREFIAPLCLDEIHHAAQFDKPWLLDVSAQEAARQIGKVSRVGSVRSAAKEGNRRRLEIRAKIRSKEEDLTEVQARADWVAEVLVEQGRLEQAQGIYDGAVEKAAKAENLKAAVEGLRYRADVYRQAAERLTEAKKAAEALEGLERLRSTTERLQALRSAVSKAEEADRLLGHARIALGAVKRIDTAEIARKADTLRRLSEDIAALRARAATLRDARDAAEAAKVRAASLGSDLVAARDELKAHAPQTCPECGQALPEETR